MLNKMRSYWWLPIAIFGVTLLWLLGAVFGFAHAYVLAGGDSPLVILEGRLPAINGVALGVGLASIGSDLVKSVSGFLLFGALMNKNLRWPARAGAVLIALTLCIPTLIWSVRSSVGFASLAFGDTIAGRGNEKVASQALTSRIEQGQARLSWLERQTSDTSSVRRANAKEATELRNELKESRKELRTTKAVGAADPGGQTLASVFGIPVERISAWTPFLLILVVEAASLFGFPAIALATSVARPTSAPNYAGETKPTSAKSDKVTETTFKSTESKENPTRKDSYSIPTLGKSFLPAREAFEMLRQGGIAVDATQDVDRSTKASRPERRGRPRLACIGDGHVEKFVDECQAKGTKPERKSYVEFCRQEYLTPMASGKMWQVVKRYGRIAKKTRLAFFDPARPTAHNTETNRSLAHH